MIKLYVDKEDFPKAELWIYSLELKKQEESIELFINGYEEPIIYDSIKLNDIWLYVIRNSL